MCGSAPGQGEDYCRLALISKEALVSSTQISMDQSEARKPNAKPEAH